MKKVLTFGVYDLTHIGHIKLFERAKALGDYLIVAIQETEYIKKLSPMHIMYIIRKKDYIL